MFEENEFELYGTCVYRFDLLTSGIQRLEDVDAGGDDGGSRSEERMVEANSGLSRARRAICGGPFVNSLTKGNNLA